MEDWIDWDLASQIVKSLKAIGMNGWMHGGERDAVIDKLKKEKIIYEISKSEFNLYDKKLRRNNPIELTGNFDHYRYIVLYEDHEKLLLELCLSFHS